jgi:hypothetical protein
VRDTKVAAQVGVVVAYPAVSMAKRGRLLVDRRF